jgi:hypothetical protein
VGQLFNRRAIGYALDCNGCGADLCTCGIHIVFFGGGYRLDLRHEPVGFGFE